ncbi:hypothetical protein CHS0354_006557 [Potamilus streckersoni]|uniref:Receptor ligand binding region domain-containing protein n=1 Tax=Potamilus streckersoni TaxID=2493646 RepID=A0AAE0TE01_9BIVA|nr:hypothetical protein CHS0354_006557 [Potamilus streckersoni]
MTIRIKRILTVPKLHITCDARLTDQNAMEKINTIIGIAILLMGMYGTSGQTIKSAELQGNVTVAGMFEIYKLSNGQCGNILPSSVMALEAVKWVFRNLNDVGYLPFKIGLLSYPTCRSLQQAVENTYDIIRRVGDTNEQNRRTIIGIIGPEYSSEAEVVSTITGTSKPIDRILQVGFSTTSATLSDSSKYPNFFRVVPDDSLQVQVLLSLIKRLEWNRIAIVYENDTYGIQAGTALKKLAGEKGVCISIFHSVAVDSPQASDPNQINNILNSILLTTPPSVSGIVFIGSDELANNLLIAASRRFANSQVSFVFSDGIQVQESVLKTFGTVLEKSRGAFAVGSPRVVITEFEQYWYTLFRNKTLLMEESLSNPWLLDVSQQKASCTSGISSCIGLNDTQPLYIQYAILSAFVIAKTFREVYNEICTNSSNCLHDIQPGQMTEKIQSLTVNFDRDFKWKIGSLSGRSLSFVGNGGISRELESSLYEVFNFRKFPAQTGNFMFIKVGDYKNNGMHLNITDVRDYDTSGNEITWPNLNKATCIAPHTCIECLSKTNPDRFVYIPGDLYIVGIVPVYDKADPFGCGAVRNVNGYQIVEAMSYAVKKTNNNTIVFPNQTIGLIILNSCNNPFVITEKITDMYKNGLNLTMGDNLDPSDTSMNNIEVFRLDNRILGFIGGLSSTISIEVSEVLQKLKFVQISYASTSPELSDRTLHPYFMRVTSPDDKQADAMMRIIKELRSDYIQVVYSEGSYGEGGRNSIRVVASANKICIAQELVIIESTAGLNYNILEELRKKSYAKIVIVFIQSHVVQRVMEAVSKDAKNGEFMFIGSEAWGKNADILKGEAKKILETSLVLSLEMHEDLDLVSYVQGVNPESKRNVVWLNEYMEAKLNCYNPWSFDKSKNHQCTSTDLFVNNVDFQMGIWNVFAYNSVLSLLNGAYKSFRSMCGPNLLRVCQKYAEYPEKVIKDIKTVQLKLNGNDSMEVFDENGDGRIGYTIYYIQSNPENLQELQYFKVGEYNTEIKLKFNPVNYTFPAIPSVCPNPTACSNCSYISISTAVPIISSSDGILIGLGVAVSVLFIALVIAIVFILRRDTPRGGINKEEFPCDYEQSFDAGSLPTRCTIMTTHREIRGGNDTNETYLRVRDNTSEIAQPGNNMTTVHHGAAARNTQSKGVFVSHAPQSSPRQLNDNDADIRVPQPPLRSLPKPQLQAVNSTYHTVQDNDMRDNNLETWHTIAAPRDTPREITENDNSINDGKNQMLTDPYIHPIP